MPYGLSDTLADAVQVPVSTVFAVCAQPNTPPERRTGRPHRLTQQDRTQLIAHATASQENRHKPLTLVAEDLGIKANKRTHHCFFASEGYYRRIARAKLFLTVKNRTACLLFVNTFYDWTISEYLLTLNYNCMISN